MKEFEIPLINSKNIKRNKTNVIFNLVKLQFKTIYSSPVSLFILFGIPNLLLLGLGILIPVHSVLPSAFGLSITMMVGILFGNFYYSFKTSSFENNAKLSNIENRQKVFSIFISIFILVLLSMSLELTVLIFFESLDIVFMDAFWFFGESNRESLNIIWKYMNYGNLYYFFIMSFFLNFVIFSLMRFCFKSGRTFQMFVLTYFLMVLIFGGVVKPDYLSQFNGAPSNWYYATEGIIINPYKSWFNWMSFITPSYFLNQQMYSALRVGSEQTIGLFGYGLDKMPLENYFSNGQLWVTYEFMEQTFEAYSLTQGWPDSNINDMLENPEFIRYLNADVRSIDYNSNYFKITGDWTWNLLVIMPFVYVIALIIPSFLLKDKRNIKR
ncbi:MAG: hypothetical protein HRS50_00475 [Mycoplasmataceae bacterium]|nr:hypothetical protein [Mycoplasmataceae bacterium]